MSDLPEIEPHRDPQTEQLLDRRRVGWQLQWIRLDDIDWRTTTERQVRSDGVDEDRLERYREALDAGAAFPAVLAWDRGAQGGWVLLGGIHRAQAHEAAGRDWLPAYTVADPHEPWILALEHNSTHGDGLSTADKVRHAMALIETHGYARPAAARMVGISLGSLDAGRARAAGMVRAFQLGVQNHYSRLTATGQARLQWCCQADDVFVEAVRTAANAKLVTAGVMGLTAAITAAGGSGPDALQAVEDYEAEHHPTAALRGSRAAPTAGQLRRSLLDTLGFDVDEVVDSCLPADRKATADLAFRAAKHLGAMAVALTDKETA